VFHEVDDLYKFQDEIGNTISVRHEDDLVYVLSRDPGRVIVIHLKSHNIDSLIEALRKAKAQLEASSQESP